MSLIHTGLTLSREEAEAVSTAGLGRRTPCAAMTRLHGGMINSVFELRFETPPGVAVLKLAPVAADGNFAREARLLQHFRALDTLTHANRALFPETLFEDAAGRTIGKATLLLERRPGLNLEQIALSPADRESVDGQLAGVLARLHHTRSQVYGPLFGDDPAESWAESMQARLANLRHEVDGKTDPQTLELIDRLLPRISGLLAPAGPPTLVHGDLWGGNILAARDTAGQLTLTGLIDPGGLFADVEYELAYLECFGTVTARFFELYEQTFPRRPGYETRRLVYWLHTMLIHVWLFGDEHYHRRAGRIAMELAAAHPGGP